MRKENCYFIWNKKENLVLNNYFNTKEFDCQCNYDDCVEQRLSIELLDKITKIREETNAPLKITSAFRCTKHQNDLRNQGVNTVVAKKSTHETGDGIDVKSSKLTVDELLLIAEKHFKSIGLAKTFLHLDTRNDVVRRWKY